MPIDYETATYSLRQAAEAADLPFNTARSHYGRKHFRIIGSEAKQVRGIGALLDLRDVMCIATAKVLIDAGVHPRIAFEAGMPFAYSGGGVGEEANDRLPARLFSTGQTVLVCHPAAGTSQVINYGDPGYLDIFNDFDNLDAPDVAASLLVPMNRVHARVLRALGVKPEAA